MSMTGRCLCGAASYEIHAEPLLAGNCHCRDCQRATGSAYAPVFFVPDGSVALQGELRWFAHPGGSGQPVQRGFCPSCGSLLLSRPAAMPGLLGVLAGTLDDPAQYRPQVDVYTSRKVPWQQLAPDACAFAELPPTPTAAQPG